MSVSQEKRLLMMAEKEILQLMDIVNVPNSKEELINMISWISSNIVDITDDYVDFNYGLLTVTVHFDDDNFYLGDIIDIWCEPPIYKDFAGLHGRFNFERPDESFSAYDFNKIKQEM